MKNNIKTKKSGFTLIETFVAITILMIVVLGPMSLLSNALQNARFISDEITATYLAQEGVELMIDERNNDHKLDTFNPTIYACELKLETDPNSSDGYNCGNLSATNIGTIFKRDITVSETAAGSNQFIITSTVIFRSRPNFPSRDIVSSSIIWGK